jgi:hypothetical protein
MNREELKARTEGKKMPDVLIEIGSIVKEMALHDEANAVEECHVMVGIYAILSQVLSSFRPVAHDATMMLLVKGIAPSVIVSESVGIALADGTEQINSEGGST